MTEYTNRTLCPNFFGNVTLNKRVFFPLSAFFARRIMVKHPRQNKRSSGSDSLADPSSNPITLNFFHKEKKNKKRKNRKQRRNEAAVPRDT